jgi:glutaredoxin
MKPTPAAKPPAKRLALLGVPVLVLVLLFATAWAAWLAWREPLLGAEVARLAQPGDVRMLSSRTCVYCDSARHWLTTHQVAFEECVIETDASCAAQFNALMAPGTPVMLVRGRPQVGFSPQRVREALAEAHASGG